MRQSVLQKRYIVALFIVAISVISCSVLGSDAVDCNSGDFHGYRIVIPLSASNLQESCSNALNATYRASFTMAAGDLNTFQQSTYLKNIKDWQTTAPSQARFSKEAAQAKLLLYGTFSDGAISEEVLIDTSNAQQYKVYVVLSNVD